MTEDSLRKKAQYERIYEQLSDLLKKTPNTVARMATISAVMHHKRSYFLWTGFYLLYKDSLVVGPYQGPLANISIEEHRGPCWTSIDQKKVINVPDVHKFPGHSAFDGRTNSVLAIPVFNRDAEIVAVLEIDSKDYNSFDEIDAEWLEKIAELVYK